MLNFWKDSMELGDKLKRVELALQDSEQIEVIDFASKSCEVGMT